MDAITQLMDEKSRLLEKIAEAAQRGDSQDVPARGGKIEKVESLVRRYENLVCDISSLNAEGSGSGTVPYSPASQAIQKSKEQKGLSSTSGRSLGKTIRGAFLTEPAEKGVHLRQIKGTI